MLNGLKHFSSSSFKIKFDKPLLAFSLSLIGGPRNKNLFTGTSGISSGFILETVTKG